MKQGVDYQRVAVCSQNPAWYLRWWSDLTDDMLDGTHLAQVDELFVQRGAEYALGAASRFHVRTCQYASCIEASATPPNGTPTLSADVTFPLSQRSPLPAASPASVLATRT